MCSGLDKSTFLFFFLHLFILSDQQGAEASILGGGGQGGSRPPIEILGGKHIVLPPPPIILTTWKIHNMQCKNSGVHPFFGLGGGGQNLEKCPPKKSARCARKVTI